MPSGLFGVDSDVIIGSNHGQSARPWVVDAALNYFSREGLRTRLNAPFSGVLLQKTMAILCRVFRLFRSKLPIMLSG